MFFKQIVVSIISFTLLFSCKKTSNYSVVQGEAQGTTYSIKYSYNKDFSKSFDSIFQVIDLSMSIYKEQSIISKINKGDTSVVVDEHFEKVFNLSKIVFTQSDSMFDPSIGLLVEAYGFGKDKHLAHLPQKALDSLLVLTGFEKIALINNKIVKQYPTSQLDFNAIAQGYTVDVIADFLLEKDIENFMIELGGEVRAKGVNEKGKLWQIGIQNPQQQEVGKINKIIALQNQALATSGNYRKINTDENGKKYVHTIHPKTGQAIPSNLLSATVVYKESCALADAYATTLMVMGYEKSLAFLNKNPDIKVFLVYVDEQQIVNSYSNF